jgi:cyclophilin family peptidyl-prolyl cis-trans isomerase/HEAT repeat protein
LKRALLVLLVACSRKVPAPADAGVKPSAFDPTVLLRAEDQRRSREIPAELKTHHDPAVRRRTARAFARIADDASVEPLVGLLADEDPETVRWAAYGLGYTCKGREDAHVRLLAARAASLGDHEGPRNAIARAIGRCGGSFSEPTLTSFLGARGAFADPALLGLGDLATRRKALTDATIGALLDAANDKGTPRDLAFYALGRAEVPVAFGPRVAEAARVALGRAGEARIFAIRTLGRAGAAGSAASAAALGRVVVDAAFGNAERAEAARALALLGTDGQNAIAQAIAELTPDAKDAIAVAKLAGSSFHVLYTLLNGLSPEQPPKRAEPALNIVASLRPPAQPTAGFARRLADLRCSAALALARAAYDADILVKCDGPGSEPFERARLAALLRRPLTRDRLTAFRALARSEHLRVREAAVAALASHPEVGEASAAILADALASKHPGLVATAAEAIHAHPERAMVLAESEKRAALDPRAPPPTANPARDLSPAVAKALTAALATAWPIDRFETRIALFEAAASVHHPGAVGAANTACGDPNPAVRERAAKALRTLAAPLTACEAAPSAPAPAAEIGSILASPQRIVFTTDAGEVGITLDPDLAPVTTSRIAALAKSGFYKGIVVHRVVPGFVVQLGDPDGDGYGGSGTPLRCETSPVPFAPLDVGMALAGRDTGSSQFFVTLSRTPHLDGEYTRIGHADGEWASLAEGDVIIDARAVP